MRNGAAFEGHGDHLALGDFAALANGVGDFSRLAKTHTDPAFFVAHDDQCAEAETAAAFDDLGGAIDENDFLREFRGLAIRTDEFSLAFAWTLAARATTAAATPSKTTTAAGSTETTTAMGGGRGGVWGGLRAGRGWGWRWGRALLNIFCFALCHNNLLVN
jgi:hypothetical protein